GRVRIPAAAAEHEAGGERGAERREANRARHGFSGSCGSLRCFGSGVLPFDVAAVAFVGAGFAEADFVVAVFALPVAGFAPVVGFAVLVAGFVEALLVGAEFFPEEAAGPAGGGRRGFAGGPGAAVTGAGIASH